MPEFDECRGGLGGRLNPTVRGLPQADIVRLIGKCQRQKCQRHE